MMAWTESGQLGSTTSAKLSPVLDAISGIAYGIAVSLFGKVLPHTYDINTAKCHASGKHLHEE